MASYYQNSIHRDSFKVKHKNDVDTSLCNVVFFNCEICSMLDLTITCNNMHNLTLLNPTYARRQIYKFDHYTRNN